MPKVQDKDFRNYKQEARNLISGLSNTQLYDLYEVVMNEMQKYQSEVRQKELEAVMEAIEGCKHLDFDRLAARKRGYRSEMAQHARAKDGNSRPNKKKV